MHAHGIATGSSLSTALWTVGKTKTRPKTHLYSQSQITTTLAASAYETQEPVELQGSGWPWHVREVNVSKKWSSAKGP